MLQPTTRPEFLLKLEHFHTHRTDNGRLSQKLTPYIRYMSAQILFVYLQIDRFTKVYSQYAPSHTIHSLTVEAIARTYLNYIFIDLSYHTYTNCFTHTISFHTVF